MKQSMFLRRALMATLLGSGLLVGVPAHAAQGIHPTQNSEDTQMAPLPPEHHMGAIAYMSGGIGADEASAMKEAAPRYPLELMFVAKEQGGHDAYLAADKIIVRDQKGRTVLDAVSDGPFLLAKLPPGQYTVEAIDHGQVRERSVRINPDKHARLVFEW